MIWVVVARPLPPPQILVRVQFALQQGWQRNIFQFEKTVELRDNSSQINGSFSYGQEDVFRHFA